MEGREQTGRKRKIPSEGVNKERRERAGERDRRQKRRDCRRDT